MVSRSLWVRFFGFGIIAACGALLLLLPNSAQAQGVERQWVGGGATDNWYDAANWSPAANPDEADFLIIGPGDVVGLDTNSVAISDGGRISILGISSNVTLNTFSIGAQGEGTFRMSGGTLTTNSASIGSSGSGTANITRFVSLWNITKDTSSDLTVGGSGEGRLNITDGADVNVADDGFIGNLASGIGVVNISDFGSTLNFTGVVSDLYIGNSGNGTLNIANNASVANDSSFIGQEFGSVGKVTIDSNGTWASTGPVMQIGASGTGTLEVRGGGSVLANDMFIGLGGTGYLDILGGSQVTISGMADLGEFVGGNAQVNVDGPNSVWNIVGDVNVGDEGVGVLDISGGGRVQNNNAGIANSNLQGGTGSGYVTVRGVGSIWDNSGILTIGEWGQGSMIVSAGAAVENTSATLGEFQSGIAEVTITGAGSRWTNSGDVRIGDDGAAVLNVLDGAAFSSAAADMAYQDGSTATVTVDGVGTAWTSTVWIIAGRSGVGTLNITGGAVVSSPSGVVSLGGTSAGSIAVVDGAGSRWEVTTSGVQVGAGSGSNGTLNVTNGGAVTNASLMTIANATGSTGAVTVSGAGSLVTVGTNLLVGAAGTGTMTIDTGGAATVSGTTDIGPLGTLAINGGSLTTTSLDNSGGGTFTFNSGTVTVDGGTFDPGVGNFSLNGTSTSTLNLQGNGNSTLSMLTVGNTGNAILNLTEGYQLTLDEVVIGASGEFVLDGGTLQVESAMNNSGGMFTFRSGTLTLNGDVFESSTTITLPSSGILSGGGSFESAINGLAGSTINVTQSSFSLGTPASFAGFVHEGTLNVGSNTASLFSAGYAQLGGMTTIASFGTINATNGIALGTGDVLEGSGTINGKVAAAVGSIIQESNGSGLTLGDANAFDGFVSAGTLIAQAGTIELLDRNQATLGSLTSLIGDASLVAANGLVLNFGNAIIGFGEVDTPDDPTKALINNGAIAGDSPAEAIILAGYVKGVGTLDNVIITGTDAPGFSPAAVTRGSVTYNGTLEIELGGLNPGSEFDQLLHILGAGIADLGGTLDVQFINGFTPSAGDTFEIITAASVLGTFDTLNLPSLPGDLLWFVNYSATSVELVSTYGADFDEDGDVDDLDLAAWESGFGSAPAAHSDGDANADALASGFDFLTWQRQFGVGVPLDVATTIPEPSSLLLALFGLFYVVRSQKRT